MRDDRQKPEQEGRQLLVPVVWIEEREYRGLQAEIHGLASDKIDGLDGCIASI